MSIATERSRANRPGRSVVGSASSRGGGSSCRSRSGRREARRASRRPRTSTSSRAACGRAATEVVEVDLALVRRLCQPLGQRRAPRRRSPSRRRVLAHLVRGSSARCARRRSGRSTPSTQTRVRRPLPRSARVERLQRVDLVRARVLPEAEEDHPGRAVRHEVIMQPSVGSRDAADLPVAPAPVRPRARATSSDAIDSNWVAPLGPHVDAFEQELAELVGVPHALALSSGTAALHLALVVLGDRPRRRGRLLVASPSRRARIPIRLRARDAGLRGRERGHLDDRSRAARAGARRAAVDPRGRSPSTSTASAATTTAIRELCAAARRDPRSRTRPSRSARRIATSPPAARATSPSSPSTATR